MFNLDRKNSYLTQTPQAFKFKDIYDPSINQKNTIQDEATLFINNNLKIKFIEGETFNNKIFSDMLVTKQHLEAINFHQKIETMISEHKLPTMIMWGEEDRVLDVSAATAFKQLIPHAQLHIFKDVGHLPMVEIPNESAAVYQQFLSTVE